MYQGTTASLVFKLNTELDLSTITKAWLTIKMDQHSKTWETDQLSIDPDEKTISVTMTQQESLAFPEGIAEAQIRIKTASSAFSTEIVKIDVKKVLRGGVI